MELMVSPRLRATTPKAEAPRTETADQRRMEAIRLEVIRVPVASASSRLALLLSTREIKPPTFRYNPSTAPCARRFRGRGVGCAEAPLSHRAHIRHRSRRSPSLREARSHRVAPADVRGRVRALG